MTTITYSEEIRDFQVRPTYKPGIVELEFFIGREDESFRAFQLYFLGPAQLKRLGQMCLDRFEQMTTQPVITTEAR